MQKLLFGILLILSGILTTSGQLIITGVVDGDLSGGNPKAIEFYAVTNIPDLSMYGFGSANNGDGSDGEEFTFPNAPISEGTFITVSNANTNSVSAFTDFFGYAPTYTSSYASINGDDAIELFMNGTLVETFGDINTSGVGQPWEYTDSWAYRSDNSLPSGSSFEIGDWSFGGPDALDKITVNGPVPFGSYTVPEPSTYALVVGGLALGIVVIRNQRRKKIAAS